MGWLLKLATGNPLLLLWAAGGIFLAGLAAGGGTAWWLQGLRLDSARGETKAVQASYDVFRAQVAAEGRLAQARAEVQRQKDLQRAKEADNEAKKRYRSLDAQYRQYRLRQRAGSDHTSRIVSRATAGAPDGDRVCYSRDTLDREITGALDRFRGRLTASVEPYDRATAVARTCKDWAAGR